MIIAIHSFQPQDEVKAAGIEANAFIRHLHKALP